MTGRILFCLIACAQLVSARVAVPPHVTGVVLAKPRPGPAPDQLAQVLSAYGSKVQREYRRIGWVQLSVPRGRTVEWFTRELALHQSLFAEVEPVYRLRFFDSGQTEPPDDPAWPSQWGMRSIFAPTAWYFATASTNTVIALIDTGVRLTHVDLRDNIWRNPGESGLDGLGNDKSTNGIDDDGNGYVDDLHGIDAVGNDTDPTDEVGHGTRLCGVMAGTGGNGIGVAGVNWSARVMPLRIGYPAGSTTEARIDWILECFEYMIDMKARGVNVRVANNSYGSSGFNTQALRDAFRVAGEHGILTVCSVGNSSSNLDVEPVYPASFDLETNLAVGSSAADLTPYPGTSFGQLTVDLMAPGQVQTTDIASDTAYGTRIGTSYAAALVTGSLALLAELAPEKSARELKDLLLTHLTKSTALEPVCRTGGSLNLGRAALHAVNWRGELAIRNVPTGEIEVSWDECPTGVSLHFSPRVDGSQPFIQVDSTTNPNDHVLLQPEGDQGYFLFLGP